MLSHKFLLGTYLVTAKKKTKQNNSYKYIVVVHDQRGSLALYPQKEAEMVIEKAVPSSFSF